MKRAQVQFSPIGKSLHECESSNLTFTLRMVIVVVCQMEIDEKTAKWKSEYKDETYYFCAPMCKQKFDRNPEKYLKSP